MPGYAPAAEGIFVQLLLSGTEIVGTRHVNSGIWYALLIRRGVSEFVDAGSVEIKIFRHFHSNPDTPTDFRDLSV